VIWIAFLLPSPEGWQEPGFCLRLLDLIEKV